MIPREILRRLKVHLGTLNLNIKVYKTPPHENLQTILQHTVGTIVSIEE